MNVIDPTTGDAATVTRNRLNVNSAAEPYIATVSKRDSLAFSWTAVSADLAATVNGLALQNTSDSKNLHITKIYCWADVPTQFKIHVNSTAPAAGTAVTGVCLNRAATKAADALAYANDTTSAFAAANTILTLRNNETTGDEFGVEHDFGGALVLGKNNVVAVYLVADTAAFECTIQGYYE